MKGQQAKAQRSEESGQRRGRKRRAKQRGTLL
jgi:hypothetical protein